MRRYVVACDHWVDLVMDESEEPATVGWPCPHCPTPRVYRVVAMGEITTSRTAVDSRLRRP
jgi:hypothetical protein